MRLLSQLLTMQLLSQLLMLSCAAYFSTSASRAFAGGASTGGGESPGSLTLTAETAEEFMQLLRVTPDPTGRIHFATTDASLTVDCEQGESASCLIVGVVNNSTIKVNGRPAEEFAATLNLVPDSSGDRFFTSTDKYFSVECIQGESASCAVSVAQPLYCAYPDATAGNDTACLVAAGADRYRYIEMREGAVVTLWVQVTHCEDVFRTGSSFRFITASGQDDGQVYELKISDVDQGVFGGIKRDGVDILGQNREFKKLENGNACKVR